MTKEQIRAGVLDYFRNVARQENVKIQPPIQKLEDFLDKDDFGRRILFVIPESIGDVFLCTALFRSIKELYPTFNLYVATKPENFEILDLNDFVHRLLPYHQSLDNLLAMEGSGSNKGLFEIAYLPFAATQRFLTYCHNGMDIIAYDLEYKPWATGDYIHPSKYIP